MADVNLARLVMFLGIANGVLILLCLLVGLLFRAGLRRFGAARKMVSAGWELKLGLGLLVAVVALVVTIVPAVVGGGYRPGPGWQAFERVGDPMGLAGTWLMFSLQALMEELLFRGLAMAGIGSIVLLIVHAIGRRVVAESQAWRPWAWLTVGIAVNLGISVTFGLVHGDNPNATGLGMINVMLAGLVLGQLLWNQASLLGAWILHWFWNATIVTLGLPISGVQLQLPVEGFGFKGARDGLLTGGQFGPEGSVPCSIALASLYIALVVRAVIEVRRHASISESSASAGATEPGEQPAFPNANSEGGPDQGDNG